jgi:hypothetical protein
MSNKYYDIIIIGSGLAGLYSAYNIKKLSPNTSFLVLEKFKKKWIGGRTNNETFFNTQIVTGAGIGRKQKDILMVKLLKELNITAPEFNFKVNYASTFTPVDITKIMDYLRKEYKNVYKTLKPENTTFKQFASKVLGENLYKRFLISVGYTDYENEDINETLFSYGMEDNKCCWKGLYIPWHNLIMKLYDTIGTKNVKFSQDVIHINKNTNTNNYRYLIQTEEGNEYTCGKVIIATTITSLRKLLPSYTIYNEIEGQNFLRLYGKFTKASSIIMKQYVKGYTIVPGPLQKIIPMDANKGVYMIAYSDNVNATLLKKYLDNNETNRRFFCVLLEKSLGIPENSLQLIAIKDFYWPIGTHYYKPLQQNIYKNREQFIEKAQHPEKNMLVVGELISENQGWTEGALESVKNVLTKKWIEN